jgi:DNA-binding CsgD family transcriptional regulator
MPMELDTKTATALLSALALAREHGGAAAALRAAGLDLDDAERLDGLSADLADLLEHDTAGDPVAEALALGFLAGRAADADPARNPRDTSSFLMDCDLVVQAAEGESILRLPWFEDGLFVGRQLPDISEMPTPVRTLCIANYTAALAGERGRFGFISYGHAYAVDAVPVRDEDGGIQAVLAVATPAPPVSPAVRAFERTAEVLDRSAALAGERADRHRRAGRSEAEAEEREAAGRAREAAEHTRANARRLHSHKTAALAETLSLTARETEVLQLASHGLSSAHIAEHLVVSTGTVRTHFENIYPKLGVSDRAAAVAAGLRHGLID